MNLIDLIKRKDRAMSEISSNVSLSSCVRGNLKMRTVELPPGSYIRIENAHEFDNLKSYPITLGWKWSAVKKASLPIFLKVILVNEQAGLCHAMFSTEVHEDESWHDILLKWPPTVGEIGSFSLIISCEAGLSKGTYWLNGSVAVIGVSPSFDSRCFIGGLIKGNGVEVGPGINPQILPSKDVKVFYVETISPEEWVKLYKKTDKLPLGMSGDPSGKYILSNAATLENVIDGSLDFIFSNHVFEHFMNPIGVLKNWSRKLRATGLVYNVVPEAHACFDLRQPLSNPEEWLLEYQEGKWEPDLGKYERWCTYTAPYNTPQNLIERKYSIHVHYYSPENAAKLAAIVVEKGFFSGYFIARSWNHKDFALILFKGKRKGL